jgi:hypothetical protein
MVGNIGLSSEAQQHLGMDEFIIRNDGSKGYIKWNMLRRYIKKISGNRLTRSEYDDQSYAELYRKCAYNMLLEPLKAKLFAPTDFTNKDIQDSLHWAIRDCWKKQRTSNKAAGQDSADDASTEVDNGPDEDEKVTPKATKKRKASDGGQSSNKATRFQTPPTSLPGAGSSTASDECSNADICP